MEDLNNKVANGGATADGILPSTEWNQVASELQNIIESMGLVLSAGNLQQLGNSLAAMIQGGSNFCTDTGSSIAYVIVPINTNFNGIGTNFNGRMAKFRPANTNTTTNPTLAAYCVSAAQIIAENGTSIAIGDISTLRDAELRYDGVSWRLLDRSKNLVVSSTYHTGYINGLTLLNDFADSDHDIQFNAGACADSTGTYNLVLGTTIKQIDVSWALGTGGGASNTLLADNWYRTFVIGGASAVTDCGFDQSSTAANLRAAAGVATGNTYDKYRQVGWVKTLAGVANITQFIQDSAYPEYVKWATPHVSETSAVAAAAITRQTFRAEAPPGVQAEISWSVKVNHGSTFEGGFWGGSLALPDVNATRANHLMYWNNENTNGDGQMQCVTYHLTDAVSNLGFRFYNFVGNIASFKEWDFLTQGYRYNRGRG